MTHELAAQFAQLAHDLDETAAGWTRLEAGDSPAPGGAPPASRGAGEEDTMSDIMSDTPETERLGLRLPCLAQLLARADGAPGEGGTSTAKPCSCSRRS
jgi:hypothetical protein